jgi:hypothetical protein
LVADDVNGNSVLGGAGGIGGKGGSGGIGGPGGQAGLSGFGLNRGNAGAGGAGGRGGDAGNGGDGGEGSGGGSYLAGGSITLINDTDAGNDAHGGQAGAGGAGGAAGAGNTGAGISGQVGAVGAAAGGGLCVGGATLSLVNTTVAGNSVASGGTGGGLNVNAGTATLDNTIVALNTSGTVSGAPSSDIAGTVAAASAFNLIGTGGAGGLTNGVSGNQVGVVNPGLGTLADNGGPTQTIALLAGSPAINAGSNALAVDPTTGKPLTTDQRGAGFPRIVGGTVDIGAYEVQATTTATATFLKLDSTTQGNWIGKYGSQGYDVIGDIPSLPSGVTVTPSGASTSIPAPSSTDKRALQNPVGSGRIGAFLYGKPNFSIDLNLADGKTHNVELYFLDWSNLGRSEQVQFTDASSGAILNTETVSSFYGGVYRTYAISGNVVITFTKLAGPNAVLSGLFFDPVSDTASFIGTNTSTKGNWMGVFGSDGYNVINNAVKYPSDVTVTPTGQTVSKFVASTTDPRALQNAPGTASGRTAGVWYAASSFAVNVHITDTATYDLSLYLLDWSNIGRSEQVQITRARDGTVLSTQSVSSFSGGVYLTWAISGDVNITFTKLAGANAVLSGLFFDPAGSIASPSRSAAATPAATTLATTTVSPSNGGSATSLAVSAGAVFMVSAAPQSSPPAGTMSLAPLITAASVSVNTPPPPAQPVTISVSVPGSKAARGAAAEARALHRAEIRLANRGRRVNLENHRRELGSSTGKEFKKL